jgi:lysozyme family protein
MAEFHECIDYVLKNEGGYVNHPADSGGPTNMGITLATLSRWRAVKRHPGRVEKVTEEDMQLLLKREACEIYEEYYWTPLRLFDVKSRSVATAILDTAVLRGPTKAVMYAQKTCNAFLPVDTRKSGLEVDGRMTAELIRRVNSNSYYGLWVEQFADFLKKAFIQISMDKPQTKVFLPGWLNRNARMLELRDEEEG